MDIQTELDTDILINLNTLQQFITLTMAVKLFKIY